MSTPREVLALHLRPDLRSPLLKPVALREADATLAALSAAGFEVLPTALVDAVLDHIDNLWHGSSVEDIRVAADALRAYREQVTP